MFRSPVPHTFRLPWKPALRANEQSWFGMVANIAAGVLKVHAEVGRPWTLEESSPSSCQCRSWFGRSLCWWWRSSCDNLFGNHMRRLYPQGQSQTRQLVITIAEFECQKPKEGSKSSVPVGRRVMLPAEMKRLSGVASL